MPSTTMTTAQEWQEEFFDWLDRIEEPVVKVTGDFAETFSEYVPQMPAWPFTGHLPSISETFENQIAFATKLFEWRVGFARQLFKAGKPMFEQLELKTPPTRKARKSTVATAKAA